MAKTPAKAKGKRRAKAKPKAKPAAKAPRTCNLQELAFLWDISVPTARALANEPSFPVISRGHKGAEWEIDIDAANGWKAAHEAQLAEAREARDAELAQIKLELVGGATVDAGRAHMPPREQKLALETEVHATNLARLRGELVPAAEIESALVEMFTNLRQRILDVPDQVARDCTLDRPARAAIQSRLEQALSAAQAEIEAAADDTAAAA